MLERRRARAGSDEINWYCRICKTTKSIRNGSFFSKSKLSLQKWTIAMLWWTREYPVIQMSKEAEITEDTAVVQGSLFYQVIEYANHSWRTRCNCTDRRITIQAQT